MVRIEGPVARLMEGAFNENFVETLGPGDARRRSARRRFRPSRSTAAMVLRSSPTGGSNDLKRLYLLAIAAARRTLDISHALLRHRRVQRLGARARRAAAACAIRILVEGDLTDAKPVKYASRYAYQRLMDQGIEIYEYQPTMMHAKTIVMDGAGACSARPTSTTARSS